MIFPRSAPDGGVAVLVVEDSPTQAEQLRYLLEGRGYRVTVAASGPQALAALRERLPALVISDIVMPAMDGYQLCRQIKTEAALNEVPVILLTSLSDPTDVVRGLESGADNFITKPYDADYLLSRIQYLLATRELRKGEHMHLGVEIVFGGQRYFITAERQQILDLLLSTYEAAVHKNVELSRAQDELRALNEQLEAANQELEAFSYSVSHDLRAPLRALDGYSTILLEDLAPQLTDEAQHYLTLVRNKGRQMTELINDLLAFSRSSRQPLNRQPVAPADLVRRALEELQAEHAGRQIELVIGDLPVCQADPALLRQVFANLLANALKFTRGCEVARIEVGCRAEADEPVYFVRDNGVGFDMQVAGRLFGVFQRFHRAEDYPGTGVGLSIVRRVVHRHGGRVWAESAVGQGATFYFTLGK